MSDSLHGVTSDAIDLLKHNIAVIDRRLEFFAYKAALRVKVGRIDRMLSLVPGLTDKRRDREAVDRLQTRRRQYLQAIDEINDGNIVRCIPMLQTMAHECVLSSKPKPPWWNPRPRSPMEELPRPEAPNVPYDRATAFLTFDAITSIIMLLTQPG